MRYDHHGEIPDQIDKIAFVLPVFFVVIMTN